MNTIERHPIRFSSKKTLGLGIVMLACCVTSGCSSLMGRTKGPLSNLDQDSLKAAGVSAGPAGMTSQTLTENGEPCFILEVRDGKKHVEKIPLTPGQAMFVGDVVKDAELYKKVGKIKLTIMRPNPNSAQLPPVRLDVDLDSTGQHVMEGQNYSLRQGDRIIVTRDETSVFRGLISPFTSGS